MVTVADGYWLQSRSTIGGGGGGGDDSVPGEVTKACMTPHMAGKLAPEVHSFHQG